jgi:hypothetical protein
MSYFVVDVESDNPTPFNGSMICFGVVMVSDLTKTFYGKTKPITEQYDEKTLTISGFSREEHLTFDDSKDVMIKFSEWIKENSIGNPIFISDNPCYDWQWINYYFHRFLGENPFGFSGRRIGDLYCGMVKDTTKNSDWKKKYRKTKHTHHPVDDSMGNAEALIEFQKMGLKIKL